MSKNHFFLKRLMVVIGIGLLLFLLYLSTYNANTIAHIVINNEKISVDIADSDALRIQGLSGRTSLKEHQGMFFIFDRSDYWGIWMKNMNFPIDIMWLDSNLKVVHIEKNVTPESYPTIYTPHTKALYVLEVQVGFTDQYGIHIGQVAMFER